MQSQKDQYSNEGKKSLGAVWWVVLAALEYVGCEGQVEDEREGYEVDEGTGEETFH
jgi:hypothetical protein